MMKKIAAFLMIFLLLLPVLNVACACAMPSHPTSISASAFNVSCDCCSESKVFSENCGRDEKGIYPVSVFTPPNLIREASGIDKAPSAVKFEKAVFESVDFHSIHFSFDSPLYLTYRTLRI